MQLYLETVLAREDHAKGSKAVRASAAVPRTLSRHLRKLYSEDRDLTIRRDTWGFFLGLIATGNAVRRLRVDRAFRRSPRASRSAR
jgi:ATP-binding cassette subfamily B protein